MTSTSKFTDERPQDIPSKLPSISKLVKERPQDIQSTEKLEKPLTLPLAGSNVIDLTQESPDVSLTSTLNTSSRETSLSDDERCEKLLAKFFLDNMYPKDTDINFLSDITGESRDFL